MESILKKFAIVSLIAITQIHSSCKKEEAPKLKIVQQIQFDNGDDPRLAYVDEILPKYTKVWTKYMHGGRSEDSHKLLAGVPNPYKQDTLVMDDYGIMIQYRKGLVIGEAEYENGVPVTRH